MTTIADAWSMGATETNAAMALNLGAVVIESSTPGHLGELFVFDDEKDSTDDLELGWHAAACMRWEDAVGARAALVDRWHGWELEQMGQQPRGGTR